MGCFPTITGLAAAICIHGQVPVGMRKGASLPQSAWDPHHFPPSRARPALSAHKGQPLAPILTADLSNSYCQRARAEKGKWE